MLICIKFKGENLVEREYFLFFGTFPCAVESFDGLALLIIASGLLYNIPKNHLTRPL